MVGRCCLCEQPAVPRKKYLCAACFHQAAASRQQDLAALSMERDARLQQLEEALADKEEQRQRDLQLLQLSEEVRESRRQVGELEARLAAIRRRTAELRQQNLDRQTRLREAGHQLGRWLQQAQRERSGQLEALGQNYLRSLDMLTRERRSRVVCRLLDILPVKLMTPTDTGQGGNGGPSAASSEEERAVVMMCGLLLPDARDDIGELIQLLPQLGSSLGYAALLLDVLSRFLQLPLLHRASFQGSTSCAWQPDSFWDMRAQPPPGALPLYAPSRSHDGHGSGAAGQLYSAVAGMAGGGAGGGAAAAAAAEARMRHDLQRALYWLQRSAGVFVHARLGPDAPLKLPPGWSPFAWLGGLCKMLAAEPRPPLSVSRVMATPSAHGHGYPPAHPHARLAAMGGLAASAVFGRVSPRQDGYMGQSMMWPDEEGGGEEEEWDIIPRPSYGRMIPPPPSQPDDVEHWAQAMYPVGSPPMQQQQHQGQGQAQQAPAAVASSPVDRLLRSARTYWAGGGNGG